MTVQSSHIKLNSCQKGVSSYCQIPRFSTLWTHASLCKCHKVVVVTVSLIKAHAPATSPSQSARTRKRSVRTRWVLFLKRKVLEFWEHMWLIYILNFDGSLKFYDFNVVVSRKWWYFLIIFFYSVPLFLLPENCGDITSICKYILRNLFFGLLS